MDSADEEEFDYDDAHDETFVLDKDEDEGVDFIDDEHLPLSRTSNAVQKNGTGTGKTKPRNRVKTGRIPKSQQSAPTKVKPKPTTSLYTAFTHANKAVVSKGPLSPASPTMHRNPSVTSNSHNSQLQQSRSTTASSSLPTPISGIIHQHPDSLASAPTLITVTQEEESEKPKPRCQRCRKSKKGCDRQRPCQRCKDAGIGIEGCISEDETGTRRGRAGGAKKAGGATTGTAVKKVTKPKKKVVAKVAV